MIEIRDVEVVANIAKVGSIHLAAADMGLTQPALTKRLKAIEDRLGLTLFHRLSRGVKLTPSGELFLEQGAKLLIHARDFNASINLHKSGDDGLLRIGVMPGVNDVFFRRCMASFAVDHPNARINIITNSSPGLCHAVHEGRIDLAIVGLGYEDEYGDDPVLHESFSFEALFELPLEVIVRKDHPILTQGVEVENIVKYPLACPTPPSLMSRNWQRLAQEKRSTFKGPQIIIDDYEFILQLIARSDFWTALFEANRSAITQREQYGFITRHDLVPSMTVGVVSRKTWAMPPAAAKLVEMIRTY